MSRVIARDRTRKMCLVEGVGFSGIGVMWYDATSPHFQAKEGFKDAPEADCRGQFGSPFPAPEGSEIEDKIADLNVANEVAFLRPN